MIYLDHSATTQPCQAAIDAAETAMTDFWGNPSSTHRLGISAREQLDNARGSVAAALGADKSSVYFTSCGTEADNWAISASVERLAKRGRHIISTAFEHHAVLAPLEQLSQNGFEVTFIKPDSDGHISLEDFRSALRPDTIFASIMLVNNEIGSIQPVKEMSRALHRVNPDAIFHTDAVQAFLHIPFTVSSLGVDLLSVSAHKICGLKGAGALWIRHGLHLPALLPGGGQESGQRSGTEAMPAIAAFGAACRAALPTFSDDVTHMTALRDMLRDRISEVPNAILLGCSDAPHIVCISVPGMRSQGLINCLQDADIYVSAGSACSRGHRSHVLQSIGAGNSEIDGAIRVSLGPENTEQDISDFLAALNHAVHQLMR